jgi:hypothetical protein
LQVTLLESLSRHNKHPNPPQLFSLNIPVPASPEIKSSNTGYISMIPSYFRKDSASERPYARSTLTMLAYDE